MKSEPPSSENPAPTEPGLEPKAPHAAATPLPPGQPAAPQFSEPPPAHTLSPEEQMALFEKELKEKDWGHQPC